MRLIDADAAIDAIKSVFSPTPTQKDIKWDCVRVVENLPTIQPQTGHWVIDRSGAYSCSKCLEPCATYIIGKPRDKFCKMCGARMVTE